MRLITFLRFVLYIFIGINSGNAFAQEKNIAVQADQLLKDDALKGAHTGICIFDPSTKDYVYKYNADKFFIPASITKLFTTYASLKFLGDSITGIKYRETKDTVFLIPTGDPTFLHEDFSNQNVFNFLSEIKKRLFFQDADCKMEKYGKGWAWDDCNEEYMAERNSLPINGNVVNFNFRSFADHKKNSELFVQPKIKNGKIKLARNENIDEVKILRNPTSNDFEIIYNNRGASINKKVPLWTDGIRTAIQILEEKIPNISYAQTKVPDGNVSFYHQIKSQPTDSVLRKMMYESNNFFAEQLLLMCSDHKLGYMSDQIFIESLLENELKEIPQKPEWVDGSGLSRYNLFTPQSFVYILDKMRIEFGLDRLKRILPTGGKGTLKNYFQSESNFIFAKTGTLSNHSSLSGYLITKKGKLLIFSIISNNYQTKFSFVKKAFEKFLVGIRNDN
ncbi:MAG: hypothetical protein FGM46_07930 [Ferruginibacter sp.]|nr:hypothetical protein [Ferruginibacter sp.]